MADQNKETRRLDRATRRLLRATKKVSRQELKQAKQLMEQRPGLTLAEALVEQGTLERAEADRLVSQLQIANLSKQEREDRELAALLRVRDLLDAQTLDTAREQLQSDVTAGTLANVLEKMKALPEQQLREALEEVRQARRPKRPNRAETSAQTPVAVQRPATHFDPGFDHTVWEGTAKGMNAFYFGAVLVALALLFEVAAMAGLLIVTRGFDLATWEGAISAIRSEALESFLLALGVVIVAAGFVGVLLFFNGLSRSVRAPKGRLRLFAVLGLLFYAAGIVAAAVWGVEHAEGFRSIGGLATVEFSPTLMVAAVGSTLGLLLMILLVGRVEALYGNARLADSAVLLAILVVVFAGASTVLLLQADHRSMAPTAAVVVMNAIVYVWMAILAKQARDSLRSEVAVSRFRQGLPY